MGVCGSSERIAWVNPFSGIAGDMALGALLAAGADLGEVERSCRAVLASGWTLEVCRESRSGIMATRAIVVVEDSEVRRDHAQIRELIASADLDERTRARALAVFAALANAEGRIHGVEPEHVHFHEVGGVDAIVDVVGTCAALESLGIDEIHSTDVVQGHGETVTSHGVMPVPVPAVLELLKGAPVRGVDVRRELTTPTGAAILAALTSAWGSMPEMKIEAVGHGAGSAHLEGRANVCQIVVGMLPVRSGAEPSDQLVVLETNVDDATGEVLAHTLRRLMETGARDAWLVPIVMKKGRPAHVVSALVDFDRLEAVREVMVAETGTLGVRSRPVGRWSADRRIDSVVVAGHSIRIKVSDHRAEAEFDDAAAAAEALDLPVREVLARAEARWAERRSADS